VNPKLTLADLESLINAAHNEVAALLHERNAQPDDPEVKTRLAAANERRRLAEVDYADQFDAAHRADAVPSWTASKNVQRATQLLDRHDARAREVNALFSKAKRGAIVDLPDGSKLIVTDRGRKTRRTRARAGLRGRRAARRVADCSVWIIVPYMPVLHTVPIQTPLVSFTDDLAMRTWAFKTHGVRGPW